MGRCSSWRRASLGLKSWPSADKSESVRVLRNNLRQPAAASCPCGVAGGFALGFFEGSWPEARPPAAGFRSLVTGGGRLLRGDG